MVDEERDAQEPLVEAALEHVREAEQDLARAQELEHRAEHEVETALEDLERAKHPVQFCVIVNGQEKVVRHRRLTYDEVVALAFNPLPPGPDLQFSVQYTRGPDANPKGTLVEGQSVEVKDRMEFDVTPTNRS